MFSEQTIKSEIQIDIFITFRDGAYITYSLKLDYSIIFTWKFWMKNV